MNKKEKDEFIEWFDSKEGKKSLDEFVNQMDQEEKYLDEFFESKKFNRIIEKLRKYVTKNGIIRDEDLLYDDKLQKTLCSYEDYCDIFGAIERKLKFENDCHMLGSIDWLEYNDLIFELAYGQGTALMVSLPPYETLEEREKRLG